MFHVFLVQRGLIGPKHSKSYTFQIIYNIFAPQEILSSPFLCIDAQELPGLVRSWKRKADDSSLVCAVFVSHGWGLGFRV